MGRKIFSPEQIIRKLREAEVLVSQGNTKEQASRQLGITAQNNPLLQLIPMRKIQDNHFLS